MNEAYIVTGGCGFVGRHLVKRLIKQGHDTIIIDNLFYEFSQAVFLS
jgi:UDP-glucose 4-epimerase